MNAKEARANSLKRSFEDYVYEERILPAINAAVLRGYFHAQVGFEGPSAISRDVLYRLIGKLEQQGYHTESNQWNLIVHW